MDPFTAKFFQARAYAVLPCSTSLAALYTSQTPTELIKGREWCSRCGTYLLDGNGQTRVSRTKKIKQAAGTPYRRTSRITCLSCGHEDVADVVAVSTSDPPALAPLRPEVPPPRIESTITPAESSNKSKPRKQKSHLQALLAQNQKKKSQEKGKEPGTSGGLAAFLDGLS